MELNFGKYDKNYSHITKSSLDERKEALSMYIDKYLGPYEQRYFGAGHKRTQYEIIDTYISYKQFILVAKMTQKGIWSQKGTKKKNQHLSHLKFDQRVNLLKTLNVLICFLTLRNLH